MSRYVVVFIMSFFFLLTVCFAAASVSVEEIQTEYFTAKISEKGLIDFRVSGEDVSAINYFSFRWLTRGEDGKSPDDWPGSAIGSPLNYKLKRKNGNEVELLQMFDDFEILWQFRPESDGKALSVSMAAAARRHFVSAEGNAQMPEIRVPDVQRVIWPSENAIFDAPPKEAKAAKLSANWVAFHRGPLKASLLMLSKNPNWHRDILFNSPKSLTNQSWPGDIPPGKEFKMDLLIVPYVGSVELAVKSVLPEEITHDIKLPGGFAFWSADNLELVPMQAENWMNRLSEPSDKSIELQLAKGEIEAFQLVFTPDTGRKYKNISLTFSELSHENGLHKLPADTFNWRRVRYHNRSRPDVLQKVKSFDTLAGQGRNYPLWVDVRMPYEAPAGKWKATVTLTSAGKVLASRKIILDVWNFQMPKRTSMNTSLFAFWSNFLSVQYDDPNSEVLEKLLKAGAESLADHRIIHGHAAGIGAVPNRIPPKESLTQKGHKYVMQWLDFWEKRGLNLGMVRIAGPFKTERRKKLVKDFWEFYWPIFKERGWDKQIYHQHSCEFSTIEAAKKSLEEAEFIRQYAPGLKMLATAISAGGTVHEAADEAVDIWGTTPLVWRNNRRFFEGRLKAGEQVWLYIHHHIRFNADGLAPRTFFWQLSRLDYDGCVLYCVNCWHDKEKVFTWTPEGLIQTKTYSGYPFGAGNLYWPAPTGRKLLESVRLEKIRDGIEDWECLKMLQERLKSSQDIPEYESWRRKARLVLLLREIVTNSDILPTEVFKHTADVSLFREIRQNVGETLAEWSAIKTGRKS